MPAKPMAELKQLLMVWIPLLKVMAAPDNSLILRLETSPQAQQIISQLRQAAEAAAQAQQAQQGGPGPMGMDARMMERYGLTRRGPGAPGGEGAAPTPTPAADLPGVPKLDVAGQGTWEREGSSSRYKIRFTSERGQSKEGSAIIDGEDLHLTTDGMTMVFMRTY